MVARSIFYCYIVKINALKIAYAISFSFPPIFRKNDL